MSVVKINAITVPEDGGDELAGRFAKRLGAVDGQPGFEEFQLLRPTDDRNTWLVYTRWSDEDAFQAWVSSPAFQHGHRGPQGGAEVAGDGAEGGASKPPVAMSSELWQFRLEQHSTTKNGG
jgi:heme-degrading monooxygenase HmoA